MAPRRSTQGLYNRTSIKPPATDDGSVRSSSRAQPTNAAAMELAQKHVDAYAAPQDGRAAWVVGVTLLLWVGSLALGTWWFRRAALNTWWGLALSACWVVVRSGILVRTFVVMHNAIHSSLFSKRWLNSVSGIIMGIMTGAHAPDYQKTHLTHHALLGIEDEVPRDPDLIILWTTKEWEAWPRGLSKAAARVMCDPLILFTVMAPIYILVFNVSWPQRVAHHSPKARLVYIAGKLLALPCLYAVMFGIFQTTLTHLWSELLANQLAMSYAMFLYTVQHTYEGVYRVPRAEYNRTAAGFQGSSFLSIPWWWRSVTLGIEYHHFHHLNARLPGYRMEECEESAPPGLWEAAGVRKLTARDGFRALVLSLWDPDQRCYVPFPEWAWLDRLLTR